MNKFNSTEKKAETIKLINDIISTFTNNRIQEIPQKSNNLVTHLFLYPSILNSDVNKFLESSDLLKTLIISLERVQETPKRDLLRLIHLLLQVKKSLREEARKSKDFQAFLLRSLDQRNCWDNRLKFKHHINIASLLLVDRDGTECHFNNDSVRRFVRESIEEIVNKNQQEEDDALPTIIFYACSMFSNTFEELLKVTSDENASEMILSKSAIAKYSDFIRDYVQEFKIFYEADDERMNLTYYKTKPGYSFQQLCNTFIYYAIQSDVVRTNMFHNGNYGIINNLLSIKYIPEYFLLCALDFLKLSFLDEVILKAVKDNFQKLIPVKLKAILKRENLQEKTKMTVQYFLEIFDSSNSYNNNNNIVNTLDVVKPPRGIIEQKKEEEKNKEEQLEDEKKGDVSLIHMTNINMKSSSFLDSFNFERWGTIDVQEWLAENNLGELRDNLCHLTGRGLKQLQSLTKKEDKMKLIDFLMIKIETSFDLTLELVDALETLDSL